jgi:hypothetical protein
MSSSSVLIKVPVHTHIQSASGSIAWEQTPGAEDGCHHYHATSTMCPEREKGGKVNRKIVSRTLKTFIHAGMIVTQHEVVLFMVGLQL